MVASISEKLIKPKKIFFKNIYAVGKRLIKVFYMNKHIIFSLGKNIS